MKKNFVKALLLGASVFVFGGFAACAKNTGPQFLEGSLETIELGESVRFDEYFEKITDDYTLVIKGENFNRDYTGRDIWTPDEPGVYSLVYTINSGEFEGTETFELTVTAPRLQWEYTLSSELYNTGEEIVFEKFFEKMNISVQSYYEWKMVMDSVVVEGETTEFSESDLSFTVESAADHTFYFHLEAEDGQRKELSQVVGIRRVDAETVKFLEDNGIVDYDTVVVADGGVTLNKSKYSDGQTMGAPRADYVSYQSYLAYDGDYGLGDFVAFDYTGNNMPALAFFCNELTSSMFCENYINPTGESDKGIVVVNGSTGNDGAPFAKWAKSVNGRLNIYGPRKISQMDNEYAGWFRESIRGVEPLGLTYQASNAETKFRLVVGFIEGMAEKFTVAVHLSNRETGEVYYDGVFTKKIPTGLTLEVTDDYYSGKIIAYGQYGKRTVLDKIYPIVHAETIVEAREKLFPSSQFKETARKEVYVNEPLGVSDYILPVEGEEYELTLTDSVGNTTAITEATFTLTEIGKYTLRFEDGVHEFALLELNASDVAPEMWDWIEENKVTYHGLQSIAADGKVVLRAGTTSGARPTSMTVNDYSYLAFNQEFKAEKTSSGDQGVYIAFDFTGNNMPNVLFFADEATPNIFNDGKATGNKGILITNGCTIADGSNFVNWETSVNNRLNIYGPNKVANMGDNVNGFFRSSIGDVDFGMTQHALNPTGQYRLVLGFVELRNTATVKYIKLTAYLTNRATGEVLYQGTRKIEGDNFAMIDDPTTYFSGKIVLYGQIGRTVTLDKVYAPIMAKGAGLGYGAFFGTN